MPGLLMRLRADGNEQVHVLGPAGQSLPGRIIVPHAVPIFVAPTTQHV